LRGVKEWFETYQNHKEYFYVGRLIGYYYDEQGNPTKALLDAQTKFQEVDEEQAKEQAERRKFPGCNTSSSSSEKGVQLWCTEKSGGIERSWVTNLLSLLRRDFYFFFRLEFHDS
jgi:hypothetical protein